MNTLQRIGIGATFGITAGFALDWPVAALENSLLLGQDSIERCVKAAHLGDVAMQTSEIPAACRDFSSDFDQATTMMSVTRHVDGHVDLSTSSTYVLPKASDFRAQALADHELGQGIERITMRLLPALGAVAGPLVAFYSSGRWGQESGLHNSKPVA